MLTTEQQNAIAAKLASMHLPAGLGDEGGGGKRLMGNIQPRRLA